MKLLLCLVVGASALFNECQQDGDPTQCPMTTENMTVYPGGSTMCAYGDPYAFQVFPGSSNRLVVYFQGGGVVANGAFAKIQRDDGGLFRTTPTPTDVGGLTSGQAPFEEDTVVYILYCSADFHVGNTTIYFTEVTPDATYVMGLHNVQAVLDWIDAQSLTLDSLVIAGESAGAEGALMWAPTIFSMFPATQTALLLDGHANPGLQPCRAAVMTDVYRMFNACNVLTATSKAQCESGAAFDKLTLYQDQIDSLPSNTPVLHIQAKVDTTLFSYFYLTELTTGARPSECDNATITYLSNEDYFQDQAAFLSAVDRDNFFSYLFDSTHHIYMDSYIFFCAAASSGFEPSLIDFITDALDGNGCSQCSGTLVSDVTTLTDCSPALVCDDTSRRRLRFAYSQSSYDDCVPPEA